MVRRLPISEYRGLRGGDHGGAHNIPLYANVVPDDSVSISDVNPIEWGRTEYTDKNGQQRIRMTRRT